MDETKIREALTSMLNAVAEQARKDALAGKSNIGGIFDNNTPELHVLDEKKINQAIEDIKRATATKEGATRLMNAILTAARIAATVGG